MLVIRVVMRTAHTLAGAAWVGGSLFYLLVVIPALKIGGPAPVLAAKIAELFKGMVNVCVGVLLLSGGYLVFDRLTQTALSVSYLVVLCVKIAAALVMFALAFYMAQSNVRRLAKRSTRLSKQAPQLMLALGLFVFLLGAVLNTLFEATPH